MIKKNILKDNSGASFLIVLLVILVLSILSVGLLQMVDFQAKNTVKNMTREEAYYTAEGLVRRVSCEMDRIAAKIISDKEITISEDSSITEQESQDFFALLNTKLSDTSPTAPLKVFEEKLKAELGMDVTVEVVQTKIVNMTGYYKINATCFYDGRDYRTVSAEYKIPFDKTFEFETDYNTGEQTVIVSSSQIINNGTINGDYTGETSGEGTFNGEQVEGGGEEALPELVITAAPQFDANSLLDTEFPTIPDNISNKLTTEGFLSIFKDQTVIDVTTDVLTEYLQVEFFEGGNGSFLLNVAPTSAPAENIVFGVERLKMNNRLTVDVKDLENPYTFVLYVKKFVAICDGQDLVINNGQNDVYLIVNQVCFASTISDARILVPDAMNIKVNGTGNVYIFYSSIDESYITTGDMPFVSWYNYYSKSSNNFPMNIYIDSPQAPVTVVGHYDNSWVNVGYARGYNESMHFSELNVNVQSDVKFRFYLDAGISLYCPFNFSLYGTGNADIILATQMELYSSPTFNLQDQNLRIIILAKDNAYNLNTHGSDLNLNYGTNGKMGVYLMGHSQIHCDSSVNRGKINFTTPEEGLERSKHLDIYYYPEITVHSHFKNYIICANLYVVYDYFGFDNTDFYGNIFSTANHGAREEDPEIKITNGSNIQSELIYAQNGAVKVDTGCTAKANVIADLIKVEQNAELTFSHVTSVKIPTKPVLKINNGSEYNYNGFTKGFKEK